MHSHNELKENTNLIDKFFPINIFLNTNSSYNILNLHWHENIEIIYMVDGHAVFNIGSQEYESAPGDILFVNSGQLHSGYSVGSTCVVFYAIVFSKSFMASQSPDPYHVKYINPFLENQMIYPGKIGKNDLHYEIIQQFIKKIICEFESRFPGYELAVKSYIQLLTVSVFRFFNLTGKPEIKPDMYERNIEKIKKLINYLEQHYTEKITIEQAAKLLNLSSFHFCKIFKKFTGRTFVDFLNLYRVNKAEELLRNTSSSITEVAEKVGFCNINYFDRIFKQYKRYPPSKCREKQ